MRSERHCFLIMTFTHKRRADVSHYCRYTEEPSGTRTQTESVCMCVYVCMRVCMRVYMCVCVWLMHGQKEHLCCAFSQCLFVCVLLGLRLSHLGSSNTTCWLWLCQSFSLVFYVPPKPTSKAKAPFIDTKPLILLHNIEHYH